ncbi:hypothetical protein Nepgr_008866 [Nepenthes gracilis]|uniref:Uncharacterized protein n=1 Tax=Nepenthes gracilis TaxID=150966 RepID=A0AAD3SAD1_NEPGR|nr:hypothetical protein Nepgr_008866 [Nepenthes gracilis]
MEDSVSRNHLLVGGEFRVEWCCATMEARSGVFVLEDASILSVTKRIGEKEGEYARVLRCGSHERLGVNSWCEAKPL